GTWLAPPWVIGARGWVQITQLAWEARELAGSLEQH
ncbi:keto-hydroxyglutarate-aldolase/keto-deoxy-phosphogluconate aldolase, partial [Pseudomonas aeruginosa]